MLDGDWDCLLIISLLIQNTAVCKFYPTSWGHPEATRRSPTVPLVENVDKYI